METHAHDRSDGEPSVDGVDLFLSRAVAGDREALRWIRERSASDPSLLEELSLMQADELRLVRAARALDDRADRIDLPRSRGSQGAVLGRWSAGLGWAVAAVLMLALLGRVVAPGEARSPSPGIPRGASGPASGPAGTQSASLGGAFATSDEAFDAYLRKAREEGVVVGDVAPPVLVGSREIAGGGGFEVLVVRTVYERRRAPELYRRTLIGESGRPGAIVIRPRTEAVQ